MENITTKKIWDVPKYNIENYTIGDYVENVEKYEMFNKWCIKEGVLMPKLKYPAEFDDSLIGTKVMEDI